MTEHEIQNQIRVALSARGCKVFRVNVGEGWIGDATWTQGGGLLIHNPRRLSTGVPKGFSDLLVICPGGRAAFVECKAAKGRASKEQERFIEVMRGMGCRAGIARSAEEAIQIVEGAIEYV